MTARKPGTSRQSAPPAGSAAAPLRGGYYVITPATEDGGAEHWPAGLDSLGPALDRLVYLSAAGPSQTLAVHHHGRPLTVLFEYAAGKCLLRPASVIPAPRPIAS